MRTAILFLLAAGLAALDLRTLAVPALASGVLASPSVQAATRRTFAALLALPLLRDGAAWIAATAGRLAAYRASRLADRRGRRLAAHRPPSVPAHADPTTED